MLFLQVILFPKTLALCLKRSTKVISRKDVPRFYLPPAGGGGWGA